MVKTSFKKAYQVRLRIILPAMLTLFTLLLGTVLGFHAYLQDQLDSHLRHDLQAVERQSQKAIGIHSDMLIELIYLLGENKDLQEAWRTRNREELLHITRPILEELRSRHQATYLYFHDLDQVCFLRVHNPAIHGDSLDLFTMAHASEWGEPDSGIELGADGSLMLRAVSPWRIGGNLVGYIELGKDVDFIVRSLSSAVGAELLFLVDKQHIQHSRWEEEQRRMGRSCDWDQLSGTTIAARTIDFDISEIETLLALSREEQAEQFFDLETDDGFFRCGLIQFTGAGDSMLGDIVVLRDISEEKVGLYRLTVNLTVSALILSILLFLITWIYLGHVENTLRRTIKALKTKITEQEKTQSTLEKKEAEWRSVVQDAPDYILTLDPGGEITFINRGVLGHLPEEIIGTSVYDYLTPAYRKKNRKAIAQVMETGETVSFEAEFDMPDGSRTDYLTRLGPILSGGKAIAIMQISTDITALKKTEEELRQITKDLRVSEEMFRTMGEAAQDGIIIIDNEGKVTYWNKAAESIFGYSAEEVLRRVLHGFLVPEDMREAFQKAYPTFRATGRGAAIGATLELTGLHKNGSEVLIELSLSALRLNSCWHGLGIVRDITERKRKEQEREDLKRELVQAEKLQSVGQLAAGIAHEINTPTQYVGDNTYFLQSAFDDLTPLIEKLSELTGTDRCEPASAELISELKAAMDKADAAYLIEEIPSAIQQSLEGIERITKIVLAMKEFSHPGGKEKQPIDINKAIETTITVARNEWKYVAEMVTDLDPELPPVPCLQGDFNQVILIFIVNAAQAIADVVGDDSREKGTIKVSTRQSNASAEIRIADTGPGIPEEIREKIFEPFFTTKEVGKGSGQGLNIAYNSVVNKHGGSIAVESEEGKGTIFIIHLPLEDRAEEQAKNPPKQLASVSDE